MMDMAHISGLVAAEEAAQPFQYADVVTTTTHKSLRGPRAGMIFFRRVRRSAQPPAARVFGRMGGASAGAGVAARRASARRHGGRLALPPAGLRHGARSPTRPCAPRSGLPVLAAGVQGPKPAARLLRDEPEGTEYAYEDAINFAVGAVSVLLLLPPLLLLLLLPTLLLLLLLLLPTLLLLLLLLLPTLLLLLLRVLLPMPPLPPSTAPRPAARASPPPPARPPQVFPSLQGGPHNHQIGALAVALKHARTPEFRAYAQQVGAPGRACPLL